METIPLNESIVGAAAAFAAVLVVLAPGRRRLDVLGTFAVLGAAGMVVFGDLAAAWTLVALLGAVLAVDAEQWDLRTPPGVRPAAIAGFLALVSLGLTADAGIELRAGAIGASAVLIVAVTELRTHGPATLTALATISAAGVYVNVPDTEHVTVVGAGLGVLTVAFALGPRRVRRELGLVGAAFAATVLLSSAAVDARGRPASFIGVVGALGVFLAEPVAQRLRRGRRAHGVVLLVVHAAVAITLGRLATDLDTRPLVAATAVAIGGATAVLAVSPRRRTTD